MGKILVVWPDFGKKVISEWMNLEFLWTLLIVSPAISRRCLNISTRAVYGFSIRSPSSLNSQRNLSDETDKKDAAVEGIIVFAFFWYGRLRTQNLPNIASPPFRHVEICRIKYVALAQIMMAQVLRFPSISQDYRYRRRPWFKLVLPTRKTCCVGRKCKAVYAKKS